LITVGAGRGDEAEAARKRAGANISTMQKKAPPRQILAELIKVDLLAL
jgi:hypothetical protein